MFVNRYADEGFTAVINNAGINPINWIENVEEHDLEECIKVNLIAPALLLKGFVPFMKRQKKGFPQIRNAEACKTRPAK